MGRLSEALWLSVLRRGGKFGLYEMQPYAMDARGHRKKNAKSKHVPKGIIDLPTTGPRYSARQHLTDVGPGGLVPNTKEVGTFLYFAKGNVPTVDALLCLPAAKGDEVFGKGSTLASAGAPLGMTVLALQMTVNTAHDLKGSGLKIVLDTVARACGPGKHCVHYVVVTNEQCAAAMEWTKPSAVDPVDERFANVKQWVLVVDENAVVEATEGEKRV